MCSNFNFPGQICFLIFLFFVHLTVICTVQLIIRILRDISGLILKVIVKTYCKNCKE